MLSILGRPFWFDAEAMGKVDISPAMGAGERGGNHVNFDEAKNNYSGINLFPLTPREGISTIEKT
jgi:hypothetical protein